MKNIINLTKKLQEKVGLEVNKRRDNFDRRSEKWQMSDKGAVYESDTNYLDELNDSMLQFINEADSWT